jgi:hypothetical protein
MTKFFLGALLMASFSGAGVYYLVDEHYFEAGPCLIIASAMFWFLVKPYINIPSISDDE